MSTVYITGLVALCLLGYILRSRLLRIITPNGIEGFPALPNPKPIVGDLLAVIDGVKRFGGMGDFADDTALKLGPQFQLRLFHKVLVFSVDYKGVLDVVADRSGKYGRDDVTSGYFGQIIPFGMLVLPTGLQWKTHRRVLAPLISSTYLNQRGNQMTEAVESMVALWEMKAKIGGGRAWRVTEDLEDLTMDIISAITFGQSWRCSDHALQQLKGGEAKAEDGKTHEVHFTTHRPALAEATVHVLESIGFPEMQFPSITHWFIRQGRAYRHHRGLLRREILQTAAVARHQSASEKPEQPMSLVDMMVKTDTEGKGIMADHEIEDEAMTMLFAGTETTASALEWWCKFVTRSPNVQVKLRQHITTQCLDTFGEITMDQLNASQTPYLEAVVHETLRLSRASPGSARLCLEDTIFLGRRVPKGAQILWMHSLRYQNQFGSEGVAEHLSGMASKSQQLGAWKKGTALDFMPERWLDDEGKFDLNAGPSLPFSHGIRACFGKSLAIHELRLTIAKINQAFFLGSLTEIQSSFQSKSAITTRPVYSFVRPIRWESEEAISATKMVSK